MEEAIFINLIMCEGKMFIPLIIQSNVLNWYNTYILRPVTDRKEATILQYL